MDLGPKLVGRSSTPDRDLYLAQIQDVVEWPHRIEEPKPHFVVFLAMDATVVPDERISSFATRLLEQGMAYVCAWGPGCARVHNVFDLADIDRDAWAEDKHVMSTWHDDEDLDEALWFAVFSAWPADAYGESCRSVLAIVVGHPEWAEHVEGRFADADRFNDEILEREPD
jgi:hypothetical protein